MAFCANCGSQVDGRFCAKCGTPVAAPGGPPPPGPPPPGPAYLPQAGLQDNVAAALCYSLWVLTGVLFLVIEPFNRNRNIRFHAFQAIFIWVAVIVVSIGVGLVTSIIDFVPFLGWLMWRCFFLAVLVLWVMLMYKAYNNEKWVLPVIGPLAEKQA
jgi:uncharacterized membrane protein